MENTQQEISLVNILNMFKKNVFTVIYFLLASLLLGFVYTAVETVSYSGTATINSDVAITAAFDSQISGSLVSDEFLTEVSDKLNEEGYTMLDGQALTSSTLSSAVSGKLVTVNGFRYDVTFVAREKDLVHPALVLIQSELVNYMKNHSVYGTGIGKSLRVNVVPAESVVKSLGSSKTTVLLIAMVLGTVVAAGIILVRELTKGTIYDKNDLTTDNLVSFKFPKQFKKLSFNNFMSWPALPINIKKGLLENDNKEAFTKVQDEIIAKVGFDNNVQLFYSAGQAELHKLFIEQYASSFVENGKKVILINLDNSGESAVDALELKKVIKDSEQGLKGLDSKLSPYLILDIGSELYPASVVNNSTFLEFVSKLSKEFDYVLINGGSKALDYSAPLSKLADPIVSVYSNRTSKKEYKKDFIQLNNEKTVTLIIG